MSSVIDENKIIAKTVASAFSGQPKIISFWGKNEKSHVDLLICEGQPQEGVNSYSTIGLSDAPILKEDNAIGIRLELVGACASSCKEFANILSTAALGIINAKMYCAPDIIFPNIVSMYKCSSTMEHLLFVPPFLWDEELSILEFDSKTVAWLLAVPISETERQYAQSNGTDKLEELFEQKQVDIYDINRPAVI